MPVLLAMISTGVSSRLPGFGYRGVEGTGVAFVGVKRCLNRTPQGKPPALTADQNSYVLAKLDELQALRDGAAQFGVDVKQKRSRASTKHEGMIDAAALKEIEKI